MASGSPSLETGTPRPAPRSGGKIGVILLVVGALLLVVAVGIHFWANGYVEACHSIAREAGRAASDELGRACALMTAVWYGSVAGAVVSFAVMMYAAVGWVRRRKAM